MKDKAMNFARAQVARAAAAGRGLVGSLEKGFQRAKIARVNAAGDLDLSAIPNYVAYKAALVREKLLLQYVCIGLAALLAAVYVTNRLEVSDLSEALRTKEFILAPGVSDFIPVAPRSVPDSYVQHAVSDFVSTLGNTTPTNIEERYAQLASLMSPALQVQFAAEAPEWVAKARAENVSELVTIQDKRIESDDRGRYKATVSTRTETFIAGEAIGYRNEVVEMGLRLVPPDAGRRWYLEITSLTRTSAEAHSAAKNLGGATNGK
jgi:hypothetical protein